MSEKWNTSVTELIMVFRGALISIIPWLERAKIYWKNGESYDDWDNIVNALYENIVFSTLIGVVEKKYNIAKYNFTYNDYSTIDFLGVRDKNYYEKKYVFIAFQSNLTPFDLVSVAELDNEERVIGYSNLKFDDSEFVFVKSIGGKRTVNEKIEVEL